MEIEGLTDDQIVALIEVWQLGSPIDVLQFFDRRDIPLGVKGRVRQAGVAADKSDKARGDAYRNMQAQIVIEVAKLNKQHRNPLGAAGGN